MCPVHHFGKGEQRSQERLRLTTSRLKVYVWKEDAPEESKAGFSFLSDVSSSGAGFYLKEKIPTGAAVRVAFESPDAKSYRGVVMWSNRFSLKQQFFGHEAVSFRVGVRLRFGSEAERQKYLKFLDEIKQRALQVKPGMKF